MEPSENIGNNEAKPWQNSPTNEVTRSENINNDETMQNKKRHTVPWEIQQMILQESLNTSAMYEMCLASKQWLLHLLPNLLSLSNLELWVDPEGFVMSMKYNIPLSMDKVAWVIDHRGLLPSIEATLPLEIRGTEFRLGFALSLPYLPRFVKTIFLPTWPLLASTPDLQYEYNNSHNIGNEVSRIYRFENGKVTYNVGPSEDDSEDDTVNDDDSIYNHAVLTSLKFSFDLIPHIYEQLYTSAHNAL